LICHTQAYIVLYKQTVTNRSKWSLCLASSIYVTNDFDYMTMLTRRRKKQVLALVADEADSERTPGRVEGKMMARAMRRRIYRVGQKIRNRRPQPPIDKFIWPLYRVGQKNCAKFFLQ